MHETWKVCGIAALVAVAAATAATAQDPVRRLGDLVGQRASSAEKSMEGRGYRLVRGEKSGDSSSTYWIEAGSMKCVTARTTNGVYASIVYAPKMDCEGGGASTRPAPTPSTEDSFDTVCGVVTGGKTYRYRCHLRNEGCHGEGYCKTVVEMPDNGYTITWHKNDEIEVVFQGMNAMRSKSSFADGQTKFDLDGKTYFVYRSPDRAKRELAHVD